MKPDRFITANQQEMSMQIDYFARRWYIQDGKRPPRYQYHAKDRRLCRTSVQSAKLPTKSTSAYREFFLPESHA
jgi:hypothetical protein